MQRRGLVILGLSTLGLVLSLVLERLHVRAYLAPGAVSFCAIGEQLDCTSVALSRWSVVLGVPVPLWGAIGFFAIGVAAVRESRWLLPLTGAGALASLVLLVVELVAIGALCLLCEAVHLVSVALFGLALSVRTSLRQPFADRKGLAAIFAPPLFTLLALALFLPHYWGAFGWKDVPPFPQGKTADGHPWIGALEPKLTLNEFTDYSCSHCKAAVARNLRRLAKHPDSLRIVRRHFPRMLCRGHSNKLCLPVRVAYCAEEQGKFWQADRWLFEHVPPNEKIDLVRAVRDIGIDFERLSACIGRADVHARAAAEARFAMQQDFDGTPSFVVNEKGVTEEELAELVNGLN